MRIVIKLGGAVCLQTETLDALGDALRSMQEEGHQPVLVHGGGPQLDAAIGKLGEKVVKHKGLRYTSKAAAAVVETELDDIGQQIAAGLVERGLHAVHLSAKAKALRAQVKRMPDGFDLGRVGTLAGLDPMAAVDMGPAPDAIPVVTPVGHDQEGPLNVNADEAAAAVAAALRADRLLLATDVSHVRNKDGEPVGMIDEVGAADLITDGSAEGGMVPKLMAAMGALSGGVGGVLVTRPEPEAFRALLADMPLVGTFIRPAVSPVDVKIVHEVMAETP